MFCNVRHDKLTSQHIEVALVYKEMLGVDEAMAYLEREHVPKAIAERTLLTEQKRRQPTKVMPSEPTSRPYVGCRRKNHVHDAIVEAALKIERKLGLQMALALLRDEKVPETVERRIAAQGPRQLRVQVARDK